jgi:hypothetical protein
MIQVFVVSYFVWMMFVGPNSGNFTFGVNMDNLKGVVWETVKDNPDAGVSEIDTDLFRYVIVRFKSIPSKSWRVFMPEHLDYFRVLAVADYRIERFEEAIASAQSSIKLMFKRSDVNRPHPIDLSILATSHLKLGEMEKANEFRKQMEEAMKLEVFKDDEECKSFAAEVAALFDADQ